MRRHFQNQQRIKRLTNSSGEEITVHWAEWDSIPDDIDPTTGSSQTPGTPKSLVTKAFTHRISPAKNLFRAHTEIQVGDIFIDLSIPFYRVSAAGQSTLTTGQVVDEVALSRANRNLPPCGRPAKGVPINISELKSISFEIDGEKWVPVNVGSDLGKTLDAVFAGKVFTQTVIVRRQQ